MKNLARLSILSMLLLPGVLRAQGCSDAGICTAPGHNDAATEGAAVSDSTRRHVIRLTGSWGLGEQAVSVFQLIPEAEISLVKNVRIQVKVPYSYATGNLGDAQGPGDISAGLVWIKPIRKTTSLRISLLGKLAAGRSDRSNRMLPLPMPYQPGLGTNDLAGAVSLHYKTWLFAAAYQHVLVHRNTNAFLHSAWSGDKAPAYFESARLRRGNDAMLRAAKNFTRNRFTFSPGLLLLYRLQEDEVNGAAVKGSDGMTLNAAVSLIYRMPGASALSLLAGTPLLVREVRPDGLTRALVVNLTYSYSFTAKNKKS